MMPRRNYVLFGLLVSFLSARLVVWFGHGTMAAFDSAGYAIVSLTGHAPRLWGTPIFYLALPDDTYRMLAQWMVGTLAWVLLAWALWTALRNLPVQISGAGSVLLLGLMPQVTNWDFMILSESLSISLGVITLAMFLLWSVTGTRWALVAMTVSAFWWTFTRGEIRVAVGVMTLALIWLAWRDRARWRPVAVAVVALVAAMGWVTAITPAQSSTFARWGVTGLPQDQEVLAYRLRFQVLTNPQIKTFYTQDLNMPECAAVDQALPALNGPRMRDFAKAYKQCSELVAWGAAHAMTSGTQFALRKPALFAVHTGSIAAPLLGGTVYAKVPSVVPRLVERMVFPGRAWVLLIVLGGLALTLLAALVTGAARTHTKVFATALVVVACSGASLLAGVVYTLGAENGRFGIQEAVGLRIAIVLLAAITLDAAVHKRQTRSQ